ncbi:Zinc finger protein GAI-ASSOCIATED FACTOR 1-like protein [Drosera capensis]
MEVDERQNSSTTSPPVTTVSTASGEASTVSFSGIQLSDDQLQADEQPKKKRNQPGMPDPEAEVVALSPKALLATNRFVCEICGKGFQRDQNLQLHRRGHNLPWKLRRRSSKDPIRKRVYVCPETTCVHHDPRRALGDLTGIKKHFCRKHGEKKWKCERCSKRYAVQSDWRAHMKTCGTREYKCDCGTLFSRRDSFVTHRAFCDVLAQESAKVQVIGSRGGVAIAAMGLAEQRNNVGFGGGCGGSSASPAAKAAVLSPVLSIHSSELPENAPSIAEATMSVSNLNNHGNGVYHNSMFAPLPAVTPQSPQNQAAFADLMAAVSSSAEQTPATFTLPPPMVNESTSLSLSSIYPFPTAYTAALPSQPALSATALLLKAAQMGSTASCYSLLGGEYGIAPASSHLPSQQDVSSSMPWNGALGVVKVESGGSMEDGFSIPTDGVFGVSGSMVDATSGLLFGSKPTTLDLLGLGIAPGNGSTNGLSAFFSSMDHRLDVVGTWDRPHARKTRLIFS